MSWPTGRGRRAWISVGPVALLVLLPFWLAIWFWYVLIVLAVMLAAGIITLARGCHA